jgi:hypothetical protein
VAKARVRNIDTDKVFRIYAETVAKARVRSILTNFSGYIQSQWPRPR